MRIFERTSQFFLRFDWILLILVIALVSIGMAAIYSVDLSRSQVQGLLSTQMTALVIGLAVLFGAAIMHNTMYQSTARLWYIVSLLLLILVLFFGQTIRGTTGWFRVGGFSFQPAEFAKVGLILWTAWWIEKQARQFKRWQYIVSTALFVLLPAGLIMMQPDLGSASILLGTWFGLVVLSGTKKRYIFGLILLGIIAVAMGWMFFFKDYQKARLITFFDPTSDPLRSGYNVNQSMIAIGSGGFFGRGLGFGTQSQLRFLPEAQTDFIFSVIAEELGMLGVLILFTIFFLLLLRLVFIAKKCTTDFAGYVVLGIAVMLSMQLIVNIGAAMGMLPVTGVTLPFVSYGGSSLIINFMLIGIAQSMTQVIRKSEDHTHALIE